MILKLTTLNSWSLIMWFLVDKSGIDNSGLMTLDLTIVELTTFNDHISKLEKQKYLFIGLNGWFLKDDPG